MKIIFVSVLTCIFSYVCFSTEHPHLLFSQADLPKLRESIQRGTPKRAWMALKERCEGYLKLSQLTAGNDLDLRKDPLTELLFAYHLSGEDKYKNKFLELLAKANLRELKYDNALIFDMGFHIIPVNKRNELKSLLVAAVNQWKSPLQTQFLAFSNWGLIPGMVGVREAAALYGHPEFNKKVLDDCAVLANQIFNYWIDVDGYPLEGISYTNYPLLRIGSVSLLIMQRKGYDFINNSNFNRLGEAVLTMSMPDGSAPPLQDSSNGDRLNGFSTRALLALNPDNHAFKYLVAATPDESPDPITGIFFYHPAEAGKEPPAKSYAFFPQNNVLVYKSDWSNSAFYSIIQARPFRGHAHEDAGNFLLSAYGEDFITDPGYGEGAATMHNITIINNAGPVSNGGFSINLSALVSGKFCLSVNDTTNFWNTTKPSSQGDPVMLAKFPVAEARRYWLALGNDPAFGTEPYLIVSDVLRKDDTIQDYSFQLQIPTGKKIQINNGKVLITGNKAGLNLDFIIPAIPDLKKEDYETIGRFRGRKFQRLIANIKKESANFAAVLIPFANLQEKAKVSDGQFGFNRTVKWGNTNDYITIEQSGAIKLLRCAANHNLSLELPQKIAYTAVLSDNWSIGGNKILTINNLSGIAERDRAVMTSAIFDGETLQLESITHPLCSNQLPFLHEVIAWAPNVKNVIVNGKKILFSVKENYVNIVFKSKPTRNAMQLREQQLLNWLDIIAKSTGKTINQEVVEK